MKTDPAVTPPVATDQQGGILFMILPLFPVPGLLFPQAEREKDRFGIVVGGIDPALAAHLGMKEGEGLLVRDVERGSVAEKAGLRAYDVLLALNGKPIAEGRFSAFRKELHRAMDLGGFTLEVIRAGTRGTLKVLRGD